MKRNSNSQGVKKSNDLRTTCKLQESIGNILDNLRSSSQLGKAEHPSLKAHHQFQGRCATHFLGNEASWCALGLSPGIIGILRRIRRFAHCAKWKVYLRHFEAILGMYWNLWIFSSSGWLLLCPVAVDPKLHFSYFSLPSFRPGIQLVTYITSTSAYFSRFPNIHLICPKIIITKDVSALHCAKVSESSSFMLEL